MADLADLITRLEAADGPSRELDAEIAVMTFVRRSEPEDLVYAKMPTRYDECKEGTYWRISRSGMSLHTAPFYTASIDAALTLLPAGHEASIVVEADGRGSARVWGRLSETTHTPVYEAATPALALCIATLKAREAKDG